MNKNIAKRWANALRSGKYRKTKDVLKRKRGKIESFCALGVLCDLYQKDSKTDKLKEKTGVSWDKNAVVIDGMDQRLPTRVRKWAGLRTNDAIIGKSYTSIADYNDAGSSFKKIADIIEKNVEAL
jgi:hypothetical protein